MVKDTGLPIKVEKILARMQDKMAEEASSLRSRVMSGTLPGADAANAAEKAYERLREEAAAEIVDCINSREEK